MDNVNKIEILEMKDDRCLIKKGSRYFHIGSLTLDVLLMHENGKSVSDIISIINSEKGIRLDNNKITEIISKFEKEADKRASRYIWGNIRIANLTKMYPLLKLLSYMFFTPVWILVLTFFCLLIVKTNIFESGISSTAINDFFKIHYSSWLIFLIISVVITFIHELGHAAATYRFGRNPNEIGFGFYLFFPVMFTDVSSVWELSQIKRIIVDLAGFYFQIITMVILMVMIYFYSPFATIGKILVYENIFLILYNLNPLFRFDGYWIFSDIFNVSNLRKKSLFAFKYMLDRCLVFFKGGVVVKKEFPAVIYVYAVVSNIFLIVILCLFLKFSIKVLTDSYLSVNDLIVYGQRIDWAKFLIRLFSVLIGGYCIIRSMFYKYLFLRNKI